MNYGIYARARATRLAALIKAAPVVSTWGNDAVLPQRWTVKHKPKAATGCRHSRAVFITLLCGKPVWECGEAGECRILSLYRYW